MDFLIRIYNQKKKMKRIKNFTSFIKESNIPLNNPSDAGEKFAGVLQANKNVKEQPKSSNSGPG